MESFKTRSLQHVLTALLLIAVSSTVNAQEDSVEKPAVVAISGGYYHSLFLMKDGSLWGAGTNISGALGDGEWSPTPRVIMTDVSAASAGAVHSLFLKKDGSVWAVGWVGSGALGDGFSADLEKKPANLYDQTKGEGILRMTPVQVMEEVAAIAAGRDRSLFLKEDGAVWATGRNDQGQLGDGTTTNRTKPVQVMTDIAAISAGDSHSLFLKKDGTVWATGRNDEGQLGDGTTTERTTPVRVMTDVAAISAGKNHSLFLKKDGTAWATGQNDDGRLGNGTKTNQLRPVSVAENVSAISAGDVHSLFLRKDGSVWGTGSNRFRHLGDALLEVQPRDRHVISPYRIMDGVSSAFAGRNHDSWFVMRDGSVLALGNNEQYKLGFMGDVSAGKPIKISFLRRPPAEIKERQETGDKPLRRFNPEVDMPILTKPPRNAVTK